MMDAIFALALSLFIYLLGSSKQRRNTSPFACGERIPVEHVSYISSLFPYVAILLAVESSLLLLFPLSPTSYSLTALILLLIPVVVND